MLMTAFLMSARVFFPDKHSFTKQLFPLDLSIKRISITPNQTPAFSQKKITALPRGLVFTQLQLFRLFITKTVRKQSMKGFG